MNRHIPSERASSPPPPALVEKLRAFKQKSKVHFVMRMDRWAEDAYVETARTWLKSMNDVCEELPQIGQRSHRWLYVAGLLALCGDKRITYDVLRMARDIALDGHDRAMQMMKDLANALLEMSKVPDNVRPLH